MNKKLKKLWYVFIFSVSIVGYFSIVFLSHTNIVESYPKVIFPANYPIIGGDFVVDWIGLFDGLAFLLGWLPYTLMRANSKKVDMDSPPTIFAGVGLFALFIALSILNEGVWRDIWHSFFISLAFGGMLSIYGSNLLQPSDPQM